MEIHVVQPGDSLFQLAQQYGLPMERLIQDNQLPNPAQLVVGQTIVIRFPALTHTVQEGDTLWSIARSHQTTVDQLLRNNPALGGRVQIFPGQTLVVRYREEPQATLSVNGYAYPNISRELLTATLPSLSTLTPFTYRFTPSGDLIPIPDEALVDVALQSGVAPVLHLSSVTEEGRFSGQTAHDLLADPAAQQRLISALVDQATLRGYRGVGVDF